MLSHAAKPCWRPWLLKGVSDLCQVTTQGLSRISYPILTLGTVPRGLKPSAQFSGIGGSTRPSRAWLSSGHRDACDLTPPGWLVALGPAGLAFLRSSDPLNHRCLRGTLTPKAVSPATARSSRTRRSDNPADIFAAFCSKLHFFPCLSGRKMSVLQGFRSQ